ncbi:MAG: DUF1778 domain-containing protein [Pseudomonadales bacterium]|nr:DUF1778 domain-containing protein [Pseudomonadales bacterium]
MNPTIKDTRLTARVPQEIQELIKSAADISGATLSQFIVEAVTAKAKSVISSDRAIKLSLTEAKTFFEILENPPKPNRKLSDAIKRHDTLIHDAD